MFKLNLSSPHMSITISKDREAKGACQSKWIFTSHPSSTGALSIASEALKIGFKNKAIAAYILLPVFLLFSALTYGTNLVSRPFEMISYAMDKKRDYLEYGFDDDAQRAIRFGFLKWIISLVIWVFFFVTSVTLSSEAYAGNKVKARDVVSKIGRWKRLLITSFYMIMISIGLFIFFAIFLGLIYAVAKGTLLVCLITVAFSVGVLGHLYVSATWMMSLVISILEDDLYGLKAIDRAGELMSGKRLQGCALKLILILANVAIYVAVFVTMFTMVEERNFVKTTKALVYPKLFVGCLMEFMGFVMYTVFYHERKASCEDGGGKGEVGSYAPIACAAEEA